MKRLKKLLIILLLTIIVFSISNQTLGAFNTTKYYSTNYRTVVYKNGKYYAKRIEIVEKSNDGLTTTFTHDEVGYKWTEPSQLNEGSSFDSTMTKCPDNLIINIITSNISTKTNADLFNAGISTNMGNEIEVDDTTGKKIYDEINSTTSQQESSSNGRIHYWCKYCRDVNGNPIECTYNSSTQTYTHPNSNSWTITSDAKALAVVNGINVKCRYINRTVNNNQTTDIWWTTLKPDSISLESRSSETQYESSSSTESIIEENYTENAKNLDNYDFQFSGNPKNIIYKGRKDLLKNVFAFFKQFIDFISGIVFSLIRVTIIGWTNIVEWGINYALYKVTN